MPHLIPRPLLFVVQVEVKHLMSQRTSHFQWLDILGTLMLSSEWKRGFFGRWEGPCLMRGSHKLPEPPACLLSLLF